ncbi:MAG: GDYXXLXY domain-containing protein [Bradymonadaceae bacterium]
MSRRTLAYIVVSVLVIGVLNGLILQKERLLDRGETVYLELAPVDPRSLIQGDYMRLDYKVADAIDNHLPAEHPRGGRVVVRLDDRRVAHFVRLYDGGELADDERLLEWRHRTWIYIGSNAFYFQEGHRKLYDDAEYGELRVDESGETILVGLRDEELEPLGPDATSEPQRD